MAPKNNVRQTKDSSQRTGGLKRTYIILFSSVLVIAAVVGIIFYLANKPGTPAIASSGYSISGTISYSGSQKPGRTYLQLVDSNGEYNGLGTSIAKPGSFIIHGVPTGNYALNVWMDITNPQSGVPNALSPMGSLTVSVNNGNLSEQNIKIEDPTTTPKPGAPTGVRVAPGNESALVQWDAPLDASGNVLAESYNVYYNTSNVSLQQGIKQAVQTNSSLFISGLNDGTTYYFVVTSVLGEAESPASTPVASVTVGAPVGLNTLSGIISFPIEARGPMFVGVSGGRGFYFQRIDKPLNPQPYHISGIPDGDYISFATIDMNNNGAIDTGDLNKTNSNPSAGNTELSINSNMTAVDETLFNSNVLTRVVTIHLSPATTNSTDMYSLEFELGGNLKLPVKVSLNGERNSSSSSDLSGFYNYYHFFQTSPTKPRVGDSYIFNVTYSDGTLEDVKVSVTGVLDGLARNLTTSGDNRNIPTFHWSAPASPPSDYAYLIQLGQRNIGREWTYPQNGAGMPSSQTSVVYNVDGSASLTNLQSGTQYDWLIFVIDSNGNQAITGSSYTP